MHTDTHQHYRGYDVHAYANALRDGSYHANVILRHDTQPASTYTFHAIAYFDDPDAAVRHAQECAVAWIDTRG